MADERVILGHNCIYSTDCAKTGVNKNVIAVGGAGSGKTMSLLEAELLETLRAKQPDNRIVICTKRRVADKYIPVFKANGWRVYDLNFSNPEKGNCAYDPLAYVKNDEELAELARVIVMVNERKEQSYADPFWDDSSMALLEAEIGLVLMTRSKAAASFSDVLDTHFQMKFEEYGSGIKTCLDSEFRRLEVKNSGCYAVNCWRTFKEAAPKTAKSIYVSMNATLGAFTTDICHCMKTKPSIDFKKLAGEKSVLFITTSPVKKALHSLANMFVAQAIAELYDIAEEQPAGVLPIPFHISFDDFATGAKVAGMPEKISIFREKGLSCTLLLQSEAQLEKMYGHWGAIEIVDNCDSYVFFGGNNVETARSVSVRADLPLEDILYMPVGQELVFRRGQRPIVTERYDIQRDALYRKITSSYERRLALRNGNYKSGGR